MTLSMTSFASREQTLPQGVLLVELRSVNHRFLEIQLKLDDRLRQSENALREAITQHCARGKVDCKIYFNADLADKQKEPALNEAAIINISQQLDRLKNYFPQHQAINLIDILRMPEVQLQAENTVENIETQALELLHLALQEFTLAKQREGEKLKAVLLDKLKEAEKQVNSVVTLLPTLIKNYQEKLTQKLKDALLEADEERVRQEIVLFAQKIDVDEELTRLRTHLSEVARVLEDSAPAGKRLDFLMQELNREANTLGAKSVSIETTQVSMALKVLIEQMREQIQNIE